MTASKQLAMAVAATGVVVDPIAVANVEAVFGAIPPDRTLHEPRKRRREGRIELTRVDLGRDHGEDLATSSWPIAPVSVRMVGA